MSHTPGPWRVIDEVEDNSIFVESPTWVVAKVLVDVSELEEEGPANARLIAAAPELLEACRRIAADGYGTALGDLEFIRAAIAKATEVR